MNEIPKAVFSRRGLGKSGADAATAGLKDARAQPAGKSAIARPSDAVMDSWLNPTVFSGDLAGDIAQLKKQSGKDIMAHGGARFAQSLVKLGVIDEYQLLVHPVALGKGTPLFNALEKPLELRLVSATPFPRGAIAHVYRPA
jgi:dihydrofolate reductase